MMCVALAMGAGVLWCYGSAAELKFRMAPVETRTIPFEFLAEPRIDILTPRFFHIVIDRHNGILVIADPFVQKFMLAPLPRLDPIGPPVISPEQNRELSHSPRTPTPYLSEVDTLLLRYTEPLVEKFER
jgi:hypothetical protein